MPIMTTSKALPPEPTSRVVIARSLPSSRIVYFTLIPVCFVNSDGVSDAMSCICGLATMATLIVFPAAWPDAVAASAAAMTISAANDEPTSVARFRTDRVRALCMTQTSSYDGRRLVRRLIQGHGRETASRPPCGPPVVRQCGERRRRRHGTSGRRSRSVASQTRRGSVRAPQGRESNSRLGGRETIDDRTHHEQLSSRLWSVYSGSRVARVGLATRRPLI